MIPTVHSIWCSWRIRLSTLLVSWFCQLQTTNCNCYLISPIDSNTWQTLKIPKSCYLLKTRARTSSVSLNCHTRIRYRSNRGRKRMRNKYRKKIISSEKCRNRAARESLASRSNWDNGCTDITTLSYRNRSRSIKICHVKCHLNRRNKNMRAANRRENCINSK